MGDGPVPGVRCVQLNILRVLLTIFAQLTFCKVIWSKLRLISNMRYNVNKPIPQVKFI